MASGRQKAYRFSNRHHRPHRAVDVRRRRQRRARAAGAHRRRRRHREARRGAAAAGIAAAFCASTSFSPQLVALVCELGQLRGAVVAAAVGAVERRTELSDFLRRAQSVRRRGRARGSGFGLLAFGRRGGGGELAFGGVEPPLGGVREEETALT